MNIHFQSKKKRFYLLLILFLCPSLVLAQKIPIIDVSVDVFAGNSQTALVNVALGIDASTLTYFLLESRSSYVASLTVTVYLSPLDRSAMVVPSRHTLYFRHHKPSEIVAGQQFVRVLNFRQPAGEYLLEIVTSTVPSVAVRQNLTIPYFFETPDIILSDILIAAEVGDKTDVEESTFNKHGIYVKPNPISSFGPSQSILKWYIESYTNYYFLSTLPATDQAELYFWISKRGENTPVNEMLESRQTRKIKIWDAIIGAFDLSILPAGEYDLHIEYAVKDIAKIAKIEKFYYSPGE